MNVNSVSTMNPPTALDPAADSATSAPVPISDPMLLLAELLINTDLQRSELDRENLEAARQAQREAMSRQVSSLHDAADDVRAGALLQGSLVAGGAVLSGTSTVLQATEDPSLTTSLLSLGGSTAHDMAGPAGQVAGEAPRLHDEADAKQAEQEATQAGWTADDARDHARRVADHSDRLLDAVSTIIESEHAGNLAILANS